MPWLKRTGQQAYQLAERPGAVSWRDVLPDGAGQHGIGADAERSRPGQRRQVVVQLTYTRAAMQAGRLTPHGWGRLDSDDLVAERGEPSRGASGACTDIEDNSASVGNKSASRRCSVAGSTLAYSEAGRVACRAYQSASAPHTAGCAPVPLTP